MYGIIVQYENKWLDMISTLLDQKQLDQSMEESTRLGTYKIHIIDKLEHENVEGVRHKMRTIIHDFTIQCTRSIRQGEWTYPDEIITPSHRSVHVKFICMNKQHYVTCNIGIYRAMREAVGENNAFVRGKKLLSPQELENNLTQFENSLNSEVIQGLIQSNGGIYIRLCRDDEMAEYPEMDIMNIFANVIAFNARFSKIIQLFYINIKKYTSYNLELTHLQL